ncbi:MAG TPA: alpha/beta fold hydrolase [Streptosporangiaceae bacterium]|jgi:surfactin synthase thioesterase subunit
MDDRGEPDRWLRTFRPVPGSAALLFCFPFAGGAASYFYPFAAALAPLAEVRAVQYPGRQDRIMEPCAQTIGELAAAIAAVLARAADRPYAFFGHSMGALVGYEVARALRRRGLPGPRWLLVSGQNAPSRTEPDYVRARDDGELVAELRALGGIDPQLLDDQDMLAVILPPLRSDYRAIEAYQHQRGQPLDCPVTALAADDDRYTTVPDVEAWAGHTAGAFDLRVFHGGHFFIDACQDEVTGIITAALGACLPASDA